MTAKRDAAPTLDEMVVKVDVKLKAANFRRGSRAPCCGLELIGGIFLADGTLIGHGTFKNVTALDKLSKVVGVTPDVAARIDEVEGRRIGRPRALAAKN